MEEHCHIVDEGCTGDSDCSCDCDECFQALEEESEEVDNKEDELYGGDIL